MEPLDCRGMACPKPVLTAKEAVDGGAERLKVLVDNQAAATNVTNFLTGQGYEVETSTQGGQDFLISGSRTGEPDREAAIEPLPACAVGEDAEPERIAVLICTDKIGRGDDGLGVKLMASYVATLKEMGPALWRLILLNDGVKMAIEGAESLAALKELEESGVSILVCGTCLTWFDLLEEKAVGETTNMLDVVTSLQVAGKVISLT
jgi:selenium metabolism protein YedF